MKTKRSVWGLLLDLFLTFITGGIWLVWILIKFLRK